MNLVAYLQQMSILCGDISIDIFRMSGQTTEEGGGEDTEWKKGGARFTRFVPTSSSNRWAHHLQDYENSKRYSEYFDPCQEAADRSLKCLRRNGGDRAMCMDYFEYVALFRAETSHSLTFDQVRTRRARNNGYEQ